MKLVIRFIIIIIMLTSLSLAYDFTEKVHVYGSGNMLAQTNTNMAGDSARGSGEQYYYRQLISKPNQLSLTSEYNLKSDGIEKRFYLKNLSGFNTGIYQTSNSNHYSINMRSSGGLLHSVSVSGFSIPNSTNLTSKSRVTFNAPTADSPSSETGVSTSYNIEGPGSLSEVLLDYSSGRHPWKIAETSITGPHFKIESGVTDEKSPVGSDISSLLENFNGMSSSTEKGVPNTDELDELNDKFDRGIINAEMYISGLRDKWESKKIDDVSLLESVKARVDKGLIKQSDFDGLSKFIADSRSKAAKTEYGLNFINAEFKNKRITDKEYLQLLNTMWKDLEITDTIYLERLKYLRENNNISESDYASRKAEVFEKSEAKSNIDLVLNDLEENFTNATKDKYLSDLHDLWAGWLIDSSKYLKILKARLDKSDITEEDYAKAKDEIFAREA
ncbi:Uncharacterised protein [uncultured archaeon]|nr:Uncharacterised protein [uncultured archaeon]